MTNRLKTFLFLILLMSVFTPLGFLLGGSRGVTLGLAASCAVGFLVFWFSDRIVLAMHQAREVKAGDSLGLYEMVERLALRAKIATPRVYVVPDHSPNAFATGRNPNRGSVAVTQGLLGALNYEELEGVLAHEISHISGRDTLASTVGATLGSAIFFLAGGRRRGGAVRLLLLAVATPLAGALIQLATSKSSEFAADAAGTRLSGNPEGLANALRKLHNMSIGMPLAAGGPATAHLYTVNPFSDSQMLGLFATHPPVEDRIHKLLES